MAEHYDIAVIGAGPGGYVAALRAAELGFKTVCIDKRPTLGGTCLNVGCIPSKALLQSTENLFHMRQEAEEHGLRIGQISVDFPQMMARKEKVVASLVHGVDTLFDHQSLAVIQGQAEFLEPHRLKITGNQKTEEIEADYILIATGSEPIPLSHLPFDEKQIVSSTGALSLSQIPQRLVVIGGGVIGVELASVYSRLGAQVIVVEMLDRICPSFDYMLSKHLLQALKKQGIQFYLSSQLITAVAQPQEVVLTIDQGIQLRQESADIVLVSIGRRPYTERLQLERIGIERDARGFVIVDEAFRTTHSHIFACGDVISGIMLAHRASAEAVAIIEALKGDYSKIHYLSIPNVVYTYPEVASVGLSEEEAKQAGLNIKVGISFFKGNARARCSGETAGFVKIIGEARSGDLLGMHILGPHASELIAEGMLAIQKKCKLHDLARAAQAHPTLSEAIKEAALDALKKPTQE
jgi:dihydrolipoamide dehydrogenase